jgi:hypothetical protein
MTDDCISRSKRIPILVGQIVQFEDYQQGRNKIRWTPTRKAAERLTRRWHDEAWNAYERCADSEAAP